MADVGPAIVGARLENVDLIAAIRPLFSYPQIAGPRIQCHRVTITVTKRIDSRQPAIATDERIVFRNSPVVMQPYRLAGVVRSQLRSDDIVTGPWCTDRHIEHAVSIKADA